jgi:predicted O-methyltransferase YrrM
MNNSLYRISLWLNNYSRSIEAFLIQKALRDAGVPHFNKIPTFTTRRELRALYKLAAACPAETIALEIGSHLGASACYLAAGLSTVHGKLYCVDTWQNETMLDGPKDTYADFQRNIQGLRDIIIPIRKASFELTQQDIETPVGMIFIDGDHRYAAVKHDFTLVKQWLASEGIIVFHDFSHENFEGVTRVVGEALASGEWMFEGLVDSLAWIKRANFQQVFTAA